MADTTLAKARALIKAADKAKGIGTNIGIRAPDEAVPFLHAAISGGMPIAQALVEAAAILKDAATALDSQDYHRTAAIIRAFLAKIGEGADGTD